MRGASAYIVIDVYEGWYVIEHSCEIHYSKLELPGNVMFSTRPKVGEEVSVRVALTLAAKEKRRASNSPEPVSRVDKSEGRARLRQSRRAEKLRQLEDSLSATQRQRYQDWQRTCARLSVEVNAESRLEYLDDLIRT